MKKARYILFTFAILLPFVCSAQDNRIAHYLGLSANGGFLQARDSITNNGKDLQANFVYEYHFKHFILQTGAGIGYASLNSPHFQTQGKLENQTDELGFPYTLVYSSSKSINYKYGYVQVPILLGAQYNQLYFLVGAKAGFDFIGKMRATESLSKTAQYDRYVSPLPLENRPKITNTNDKPFILDTRLSAEIGLRLTRKHYVSSYRTNTIPTCRIGAYFDYGLIPIGAVLEDYAFDLSCGIKATLLFQPAKIGGCKCPK